MVEYRAPWLTEGIITHSGAMSCNQINKKSTVITKVEFKITNCYVKNIIMQSDIIRDNYDIYYPDDEHIALYRRLMRYRKPTKNFINKASACGYSTHIDKWELDTCKCIVYGEKTIYSRLVNIGQINDTQAFLGEYLDTEIDVEIIEGGLTFSFEKIIKD